MELQAKSRQKFGKAVKALRKEGLIPAELYGHGVPNVHLSVAEKDFGRVFKEAGESTVIDLMIDGKKHAALIHDIDRHFLHGQVAHVDFYEIHAGQKLRVKVPLEFVGEAPAVKVKGGILTKSVLDLEVEALPKDLPHKLTVDISALDDLNKSLHISDIKIPSGVKVLADEHTAVVSVTPPRVEEVVEAAPADVSAVKVETEEKKAERAKEKEAGSPAEAKGEAPKQEAAKK